MPTMYHILKDININISSSVKLRFITTCKHSVSHNILYRTLPAGETQNPVKLWSCQQSRRFKLFACNIATFTILSTSWHGKINEFDPPSDIECSLYKPPHYLHACTKNLSNMEGFVSKTTNFLPKVMLSLRITLLPCPNLEESITTTITAPELTY
jgi:hypothetical protein